MSYTKQNTNRGQNKTVKVCLEIAFEKQRRWCMAWQLTKLINYLFGSFEQTLQLLFKHAEKGKALESSWVRNFNELQHMKMPSLDNILEQIWEFDLLQKQALLTPAFCYLCSHLRGDFFCWDSPLSIAASVPGWLSWASGVAGAWSSSWITLFLSGAATGPVSAASGGTGGLESKWHQLHRPPSAALWATGAVSPSVPAGTAGTTTPWGPLLWLR